MQQADEQRSIVRMLGAVLGDVIREEDGAEVFQQIEEIRRASVAFHREGSDDAAELLSKRLEGLSLAEAVRFVHSFACFLQITNIAEDHIQRRRGREGDARPDTLAGALRLLKDQGRGQSDISDLLSGALIVPVITAHPSEVRRKSVLDRQNAIAASLTAMDCGFNGWPQHFSFSRNWSGANEATATDLLFSGSAGRDLGSLEARRDDARDWSIVRPRTFVDLFGSGANRRHSSAPSSAVETGVDLV